MLGVVLKGNSPTTYGAAFSRVFPAAEGAACLFNDYTVMVALWASYRGRAFRVRWVVIRIDALSLEYRRHQPFGIVDAIFGAAGSAMENYAFLPNVVRVILANELRFAIAAPQKWYGCEEAGRIPFHTG